MSHTCFLIGIVWLLIHQCGWRHRVYWLLYLGLYWGHYFLLCVMGPKHRKRTINQTNNITDSYIQFNVLFSVLWYNTIICCKYTDKPANSKILVSHCMLDLTCSFWYLLFWYHLFYHRRSPTCRWKMKEVWSRNLCNVVSPGLLQWRTE